MHKTIVLIAATLALASVGFADTETMLILAAMAVFSFGEVKVECKDPADGWRVSLVREIAPDGGIDRKKSV